MPAPADALLTLYALQQGLIIAAQEHDESMISGSETEQRLAKAQLDEGEASRLDFVGINFGAGRKVGCVAHTSGFRTSLNRWILDWGLAALHPNSPVHNSTDQELGKVS